MKYWARWACVLGGACLLSVAPARAEDAAPAAAAKKSGIVVDIKTNRIVLRDIAQAGTRLVAVGERGFTMVSDDAGASWKSIATPVTRTLTGVAFKDAKVGVAVGHGASVTPYLIFEMPCSAELAPTIIGDAPDVPPNVAV